MISVRRPGPLPMLLVGNLLPLRVESIDAAEKATNLGIGTGVGGVFATLLNPLGGAALTLAFAALMGAVAGVPLLGAAVLPAVATRDPRPDELSGGDVRPTLRENLAALLSALRHHDVRWVFSGRALMIVGYFLVIGYLLTDHIGVPDRLGRRRPFVLIAGLGAAAAMLLPLCAPAWTTMSVIGALGGYPSLFAVGAISSLIGALAVLPVKGVR